MKGFRIKTLALTCSLAVIATVATPARAAGLPEDIPVHISADEMSHERDLGIVRASGRVEISQSERTLIADTVVYNQRQDVVAATGNVTLMEPSGDVIFADYMELSGDMKDGTIDALKIKLADSSRFAAAKALRSNGNRTELDRAVYSPCKPCEKDPNRPPLWQLKAVKVVHDQKEQSIEYKDAWMEFAGVPVVYTPYLSHPDPTVKRRSGFLTPSFGGSSDLGFVLRTPYFVNIAPNRDATITPTFTGEKALSLAGEYRQRLQKSTLEGTGSATYDDANIYGHIDAAGEFDVNDTWRWGFTANRTNNDTYLRRYGYQSDPVLTSSLYTEGFRRKNYMMASAYTYQDTRTDADSKESPIVLPYLEFSHVGNPNRFGARTELDLNAVALTRTNGQDSRRMSAKAGWVLPYTSRVGEVYTLSATLQGDAYHVNSLPQTGDKDNYSGFAGRLHPQVEMAWRFPLVRQSETTYQVVEPVVAAVVAPYGGNPPTAPNEDSQGFEFDDTNLFSPNRFSGYDRVEGGPRVNYGLNWGVYGAGGGFTSVRVGQSVRMKEDDTFARGSGLEEHFSDIVGSVHVSPGDLIDLQYRTRLGKNDLAANRNELQLTAGVPLLTVTGNYVYYDRQEGSEFAGREEFTTGVQSELTRHWNGSLRSVRDLTDDGGQRSFGFNLAYEDECLVFSTDLVRNFYQDGDLKPTDTIMFRLTFKTLGEVQSGVTQLN